MLPDYWPAFAQFVAKPGQHFGEAEPSGPPCVRETSNLAAGAGAPVSSNAEEFRKRADECYSLSVLLRNPGHKSVALYLAAAWLELAQQVERREAARDRTITIATPPADPQPKDQPEDQIE